MSDLEPAAIASPSVLPPGAAGDGVAPSITDEHPAPPPGAPSGVPGLPPGWRPTPELAAAWGIDVDETAAAGVADAGAPLPHLDTIQAAFGAHDVTGVPAHVGGVSADAAATIGAEAYATAGHVAFAREPSVFVAAHEAAHVVQQRQGVQLLGGLGQVGDPYEQQADAVAARVVAGESAEDLLGPVAEATSAEGDGVQCSLERVPVIEELPSSAGPEPTYRVPHDDPSARQSRQLRRDGWRPLLLAQASARDGYATVRALGWDKPHAKRAGLDAASAVAAHVAAVEPGDHDDVTRGWFTETVAAVTLLLDALVDVGGGKAREVSTLRVALSGLEANAPGGWGGAPRTEAAALEAAGPPDTTDAQLRAVGPGQLRLAAAALSGAIERFRRETYGEDESVAKGGSSENKRPILVAAAAASGEHVAYLLAALARGELADRDAGLDDAVEEYLTEAQRFASWAMALDPVEEAAQAVADAAAPLAKRLGRAGVEVADPRPRNEDVSKVEDKVSELAILWGKAMSAQGDAMAELEVPHDDDASTPWYEGLLVEVAEACLVAGLTGATGALAVAFLNVTDNVLKGAVSAAVKDSEKELMKGVEKHAAKVDGASQLDGKAARKQFFKSQRSTLYDAAITMSTRIHTRVSVEARHTAGGAAMLAELIGQVEGSFDSIKEAYKAVGVQHWAEYVARASRGVDLASGGADMENAGAFADGLLHDPSMSGTLCLTVALPSNLDQPRITDEITRSRTGTEAHVIGAHVVGLADSDRKALGGRCVRDFTMPIHVVGFVGDATALRVSSNGQGGYWLHELTDVGIAWLGEQRLGAGVEAVPGVFETIGELAVDAVGEV